MQEYIRRVFRHPLSVPVAVGVISFGAGIGLGYVIGKRSKPEEIHIVPDSVDIQSALSSKERTLELGKKINEFLVDNGEEPMDLEEEEQEVIITIAEAKDDDDDVEWVEVQKDVFVEKELFAHNGDDDWNYEEEVKKRSTTAPYVLHKDEFYADEKDYSQITLTYYAGDDILTDEDDSPIYNHRNVVGEMLFGHGSGDPNVFYVRNDKNRAEYEILYQPGLYSEEVLGLEIENNERARDLKHSQPKFRMD